MCDKQNALYFIKAMKEAGESDGIRRLWHVKIS